MMYEVCNNSIYSNELKEAEANHSKNENYIKIAKTLTHIDFEKNVLRKLMNCTNHPTNFKRHLKSLLHKGLLAIDDYSFAVLTINANNT